MLEIVKPYALGLVRHGLGVAGTALVAKGWGDESTATALIGAGLGLFGVGWSMLEKWMRN